MKHTKSILTAALCLVTICLVVTLAVAGTRYAFQDEISAQEWQAKETAMKELLPATSYKAVKSKTGEVYAAISDEKTQGYLITTSAYGYGSDVIVMTAIQEGVIKEVRVLDASEETPGLGQNVSKESFTSQFQGLKQAPALGKSSENGTIEVLTGATRSSNAVASAVATAFTTYQEIASQKGGTSLMENEKLASVFTKGLIKENPVLRLMLGTCPTLAVTTSALNGFGMGVAATFVLLGSNVAISALRKVIPDKVRIPAFITIIAGFVTIVQLLIKAKAPALDATLGIYLPLIVVNCIILGRAEAYAKDHPVLSSALDGLGMGAGFTLALVCMGGIREILGSGTLFGITLTGDVIPPMTIMLLPPGGFFVFGMLVMLVNKLGKEKTPELNCGACPIADACALPKEGSDPSCK